jgi:hypothetical protein
MLAACPIAAQCLPGPLLQPSRETRELDIALAMAFRFWDLVVAHKKPFVLPEVAVVVAELAPVEPEPEPTPPTPAAEALAEALSAGPLFASRREPDGRAD